MLRTAAQQQASQMPFDPNLKATPSAFSNRTFQLAALPAQPNMRQATSFGVRLSAPSMCHACQQTKSLATFNMEIDERSGGVIISDCCCPSTGFGSSSCSAHLRLHKKDAVCATDVCCTLVTATAPATGHRPGSRSPSSAAEHVTPIPGLCKPGNPWTAGPPFK